MTSTDRPGPDRRSQRRLMLVHAHPDDESITTGATMAHYAAAGAQVCLVTCTRGEQGEVIPPQLAHLHGAALGRHRSHRGTELLDLLGAELLEHFGGLVGAQGHQEQGALVEPFIVAAHCFPSIP